MKNEKQESPAAEILWLRGLRAFVAENRVRGNSRALNTKAIPNRQTISEHGPTSARLFCMKRYDAPQQSDAVSIISAGTRVERDAVIVYRQNLQGPSRVPPA